MNYKQGLGTVLAVAMLVSTTACSLTPKEVNFPANAGPMAHFSILQENDSYKIEGLEKGSVGGVARLRSLRRQLEAKGEKLLLLHGGDLLFPSVMSKYLRADAMIRVLNLMDGDPSAYDDNLVIVFGNHEFDDPDPGVVLGRIAQSDFAWVSTNTRYRSTENATGEPFSKRLNNVYGLMVKEIDGIKVGLFGITLDAQKTPYVAYEYEPQARRATIKKAIEELKAKGAAMVIALTHQDFDQDQWLAREFPEVNLIIGGHEHFFIEKQIGRTWITKADADNKSAVLHEVKLSRNGELAVSYRKIDLDASIEKDPQVQAEVQKQMERLAQLFKKNGKDLNQVIGRTQYLLEGLEPAVRGRETALGDFLADVIKDRMQADIGFTNGGGIRINDNIPPGPITAYDMEGIFYYDNGLASFNLSGEQVLEILRNSVSKSHLGDGRFLQVSGIRFQYHVREEDGRPVYAIEARDIEIKPRGSNTYQPLDLNRTYRAAATDFIWENGYLDGYAIFSRGAGKTSPERLDNGEMASFRQAVEHAIAKLPKKTITNRVEGRINRVDS